MSIRFACNIRLGDENAGKPSLAEIVDQSLLWLRSHRNVKVTDELAEMLATGCERTEVAPGSYVDARRHCADGQTLWAMRYGHPDREDPQVRWLAEIGYRENSTSEPPWFSCSLHLQRQSGTVVPVRRGASRPRIVLDVVERWGGWNGLPVTPDFEEVDNHGAEDLVKALESSDRRLPIVFVSATNELDRPVTDVSRLAQTLVGVAHVVVAKDRFTTLYGLKKCLPAQLMAWDGSVRIYWPGFGLNDPSYRHTLWPQNTVRGNSGFDRELLSLISSATVGSIHPEAVTWDVVQRAHRQDLLQQAKEKGNLEDLLELYEEDNKTLRRGLDDFQARIVESEKELKDIRAQRDSWRQNYEGLLRGEVGEGDIPQEPPVETVGDALEWAELNFEKELVFKLNKRSDGATSLFKDPLSVYRALAFLATVYRDAKLGVQPCSDFGVPMREACGMKWLGLQNEGAMKKYHDWYHVKYGDQTLPLGMHVGTGSSKDPRHTIRIAFHWLEDEGRVLIGYVGQHQKTSAT